MSLRSTLGIFVFAALAVSATASIQNYRATGVFDQASGDYEPLLGTAFTYDFSYDTEAPDLGDEFIGSFSILSTHLETSMGSVDGMGRVDVDKDPEYGSVAIVAGVIQDEMEVQSYGLIIPDLAPQNGILPTDLVSLAATSSSGPVFVLTGNSYPTFDGNGMAFSSKVTIEAVPEPATILALSACAVTLLRKRRGR